MTVDDFHALYKVLSDPDIMQHYPYAFDKDQVRSWIERNIKRYRVFGFGLWAVCLKMTGEMIGNCGLTTQIINGEIKPEIGYHIRTDKQRKGYAKEATIAVRDWAFSNTPFKAIYSFMKYTNEASARTAMAYGCRQVDEFSDDINEITKVFAISKDECINL
jgi:RimJ/RimL family protein N-acetyltransferase